MEIEIDKDHCIKLSKSSYNNFYWRIPFRIEGCDVIQQEFTDGEKIWQGGKLGTLDEKGNFIVEFYLHMTEEVDGFNETLELNTEDIDKQNRWT